MIQNLIFLEGLLQEHLQFEIAWRFSFPVYLIHICEDFENQCQPYKQFRLLINFYHFLSDEYASLALNTAYEIVLYSGHLSYPNLLTIQ